MPIVVRSYQGCEKCSGGKQHQSASYVFDPAAPDSNVKCPWLRPTEDQSDSPLPLCWLCRQLNFDYLFSNPTDKIKVPSNPHADTTTTNESKLVELKDGVVLGTLSEILHRSGRGLKEQRSPSRNVCAFCALLFQGGKPEKKSQERGLKDAKVVLSSHYRRADGRFSSIQTKSEAEARPDMLHLSLALRSEASFSTIAMNVERVLGLGFNDARGLGNLAACRRIAAEHETVDFKLLGRWISDCHGHAVNGSSASIPTPKPTQLRLIDTQKYSLCGPFRTSPPYLALSYVRGEIAASTLTKQNISLLEAEGIFSPDQAGVPRVIHDAILACRSLGVRYLWEESLCVMQDSSEKYFHMRQLDSIFGHARCTIVATDGHDAHASIPGVREGTRECQQDLMEINRNVFIAGSLPYLMQEVWKGAWVNRNWSLQERVLSPRKLYFTAAKVGYDCPHGRMEEDSHFDIHANPSYAPGTGRHMGANQPSFQISQAGRHNLDIYEDLVAEYSRRFAHQGKKVVDSFRCLSNAMERELFRGTPILYGLPLRVLDIALLWRPTGHLKGRNDNIPSWSWMAWKCAVKFDSYGNHSERLRSCVAWLDPSKQGNFLPRHVTGRPSPSWPGWKSWERQVLSEGLIDGDVAAYTLKNVKTPSGPMYCHPISDKSATRASPMEESAAGLHLRAQIAKLRVSGEHTGRSDSDFHCALGNHAEATCQLWIEDDCGKKAGILYLDGNSFLGTDFAAQGSSHYFIKLSQETYGQGDDDPAWDVESRSLLGEPGEPAINPQESEGPEWAMFDENVYELNICWGLYNVLMVDFVNDVAYRKAIGKVHIYAFDNASPQWEHVILG